MNLKVLHLNMMFQAYHIDKIIPYLKKEQFDVINLQEVAGGSISFGKDNYKALVDALPGYKNFFAKRFSTEDDPKSYFANVIFFNDSFSLLKEKIIWLNKEKTMPQDWYEYTKTHVTELPYNAQHLRLQKGKTVFDVVNCHLPWGPTPEDEEYKLEYNQVLFKYVRDHVKRPFILTGDFNLVYNSYAVGWFGSIARNLTIEYDVTNTLDPEIHAAKHLFPKGFAVDYIFITDDIELKEFKVLEDQRLSDHLGLYLEVEI